LSQRGRKERRKKTLPRGKGQFKHRGEKKERHYSFYHSSEGRWSKRERGSRFPGGGAPAVSLPEKASSLDGKGKSVIFGNRSVWSQKSANNEGPRLRNKGKAFPAKKTETKARLVAEEAALQGGEAWGKRAPPPR